MGIRQALNRHPLIAVIVVVLVMGLLGYLWFGNAQAPFLAYYTTDGGATLFADDVRRIPPFDHDGKIAVKAFVFTCDDGKHHFVQYLQKYSNEVKRQLEATHTTRTLSTGLIKKPGDEKWISESDPKAAAMTQPRCPDGAGPGPIRQFLP